MKINCKLCDFETQELRIRNFIANVCPNCEREIGVYGFPLDKKYTVDHALNRRIDITAHYDVDDLIDSAESNGLT